MTKLRITEVHHKLMIVGGGGGGGGGGAPVRDGGVLVALDHQSGFPIRDSLEIHTTPQNVGKPHGFQLS